MNTQFYNLYNSTAPFNKEILKDEIPTDFYEQWQLLHSETEEDIR